MELKRECISQANIRPIEVQLENDESLMLTEKFLEFLKDCIVFGRDKKGCLVSTEKKAAVDVNL